MQTVMGGSVGVSDIERNKKSAYLLQSRFPVDDRRVFIADDVDKGQSRAANHSGRTNGRIAGGLMDSGFGMSQSDGSMPSSYHP